MARYVRLTRVMRHLQYLEPMRLYELARDAGKNMISCDLGEGTCGVVLHLYGSNKVVPFRGVDPLKEPLKVLRLGEMGATAVATELNVLADEYDAAGFYFGHPADIRFINDPRNGRGVREALVRIDQTGLLAGRIMTFVNEQGSSNKALGSLKTLNPNVTKSRLKKAGLIDVFSAKSFTAEFLIKASSGTLYDGEDDIVSEDYLERLAYRMGFRRHVPRQ